jgi:arylsulfatase A-like enzyme
VTRASARAVLAALGTAALACGGASTPTPAPPTPLAQELRPALIGTEARQALLLRPERPEGRSFRVALPAEPSLTFGFGLPERALAGPSAPGDFEFGIEQEGQWRVLGRRRVDPARLEDRRWFTASIDLSAWAGQEVTLRFRVLPDPGERAPIGAIANPTLVSAGHRDERPNLLIVSLDTLFLDAFARRGTLFETAITTSVNTGPSHMSLFTGLYPVNHGIRSGEQRKYADVPTLASKLAAAGYQTAAFTENRSTERESPGEVRVTFPQAERWIGDHAREPFFAFVHTYEVHAPYRPPPAYWKLYAGDGLAGPDSERMRKARDSYDREIRFVDDMLRSLIAALEAQGKLERTLVVVLSDHGEEFSEHGYYQHGGTVFDETLRIPMIFVGPGVAPGRRIAAQVSLIDVLPTLLDLLGVEGVAESDGMSLAAALRGGPEPETRTLFAEANAPKRWIRPLEGEEWRRPLVAVRRQDEKFIVHRPRDGGPADPTRRYDLAADALERSPRPIEPGTLAQVDALVDDYLRGRKPREAAPPEPLDPGLRERLHALGYLDAGTEARGEPEAGDAP